MTTLRIGLGALALAVLAACGGGQSNPPAPTTNETVRIIAFGDSLTDGGAYSRGNSLILQSQGIPKAGADLVGKFTNSPGDNWVETFAKKLNTTIAPERFEVGEASPVFTSNGMNSAANATNYAQGGSRVALNPGVGCNPNAQGKCTAQAAVPLTTQIDRALAKGRFVATDLVLFWGGANDVFYNADLAGKEITAASIAAGRALTTAETQLIVAKYVIAMETAGLAAIEQIKRIRANGGERVVLFTVPNAANTPAGVAAGASGQALFTALSGAYNAQIQKELSLNDQGILVFDAGGLASSWYANPTANGFVNVQLPICNVPAALGSSSSFCFAVPGSPFLRALPAGVTQANSLFADGVHPSLAAHAKFADALSVALKAKGWIK